MKKILSFASRALPHVTLILSLMLLTFFVIDLFNEYMAFLNNALTKALLAADCVCAIALSVCRIVRRETEPAPDDPLPPEDDQGGTL